jgi:hypothetical protein
MLLDSRLARELAEAMLDAIEMVQETTQPAAVVTVGEVAVATRQFEMAEAILVVVPAEEPNPPKEKPISKAA